jgi:tetratricopeptide (TPR) repeat protein
VLITNIYAQQGKTEQAMTAGTEALKHDDSFALPYTLKAEDAFKHNKYAEAEQAAQDAIKRDPKQAAALRILGTLEAWRGEAKALDQLNQAIALNANDLEALAARGSYNFMKGRLTEFDADRTAVLAISTDTPEALLMQAMRADLDHDLPKAYEWVGKAIQQKPDRAELYFYRAIFNSTTEKENKTIFADLDKALQLNPDYYPAQAEKVIVHFFTFDTVDMTSEGKRIMAAVPELGFGERMMVLNYLRIQDWDQALEWANKLVDLLPDAAGSYNLRGRVYLGKSDYTLATYNFSKATQLYPNSLDARFGMAETYRMKSEDGAITFLNEAVDKAPKAPDAYVQRAYMYLNMSENVKARADIDQALQLDPMYFDGLEARTLVNIYDGNFSNASEDIARLSDLFPKMPDAHYLRGMVFLRQKDMDAQGALDELKKAIDILPTDSWAYSLAAEASYYLKNYDEAVNYANSCLKLDPKDSNALSWLSEIFYMKKDYVQTVDYAKKALALKPSMTWLYLNMADANVALGDYATAAQNLKDALANQKNLNTDGVQKAEKDLAFYVTVPPLVNGLRTVSDKGNGFSISYSTAWTPKPIPSDMEGAKLYITDSKNDGIELFLQVVPLNDGYAAYYTAQMIADFYRQYLALQLKYKFTTRAQLKGLEFGYVDTYEATFKNSSGKSYQVTGQIYYFYTTGKLIVITSLGLPDTFPKYKAEADKVAATLKFIK